MELKEFIKNTLISIKEGVHGANEELAKTEGKTLGENADALYSMHASKSHTIEFDVAVTISSEDEGSEGAGGKINISVVSLGGEIGNKTKQAETNVSRIKFGITPRSEVA